MTTIQMARGQVARSRVAKRDGQGPSLARGSPCGERATGSRERVLCSEDLYNWWGGVEEVTF